MSINFGKYAGSTAKEVAIVDPGYAAWAASNLKNAAMRSAFTQALKDAKSATAEEVAAAHVDPSSQHYGKVVEMVKADQAAATKETARINKILSDWSAESGHPVQKLKAISDRYSCDFEDAPAHMFSSTTVYQIFLKYMRMF